MNNMTPKQIKALREALNMSQPQFAKELGLSAKYGRFTVMRWEQGANTPHPVHITNMLKLKARINQ